MSSTGLLVCQMAATSLEKGGLQLLPPGDFAQEPSKLDLWGWIQSELGELAVAKSPSFDLRRSLQSELGQGKFAFKPSNFDLWFLEHFDDPFQVNMRLISRN